MNGLKWFRLWSDIVDDEKLRLLDFTDRWHFVALLACKARGIVDDDGGLKRRKVAVKLGLDEAALDDVARRLADVGLVDFATLQPVAWSRRQFLSDSSTDRVRAHRERKQFRETFQGRSENVNETPPEADPEADPEPDRKAGGREKGERAQAVKTSPAKRSPRGSRLPAEFPGVAELEWCGRERPDLNPTKVADRFRDHWVAVPGVKGQKSDWPATWRNWVRNERESHRMAMTSPHRTLQSASVSSALALSGLSRVREIVDV